MTRKSIQSPSEHLVDTVAWLSLANTTIIFYIILNLPLLKNIPAPLHYTMDGLFVPSLSSCHEKATVALYFGRIRTRLGIIHFRVFRLFL